MKNSILMILLLALLGTGLRAQTQCQASFTSAPAGVGFAPLAIYFESTSTFPNTAIPSYFWDFGDGGVGNGSVYWHTYNAPGTYNVCMTFTDLGTGCTSQICQTVLVSAPAGPSGPLCNAYFMGNGSVNGIGNTFTYTGGLLSSGIPVPGAVYSWDFGDGSPAVTGTSNQVTHTFPQTTLGAAYQVCLIATDSASGCTAFYCDYQYVQAAFPCDAIFSAYEFYYGEVSVNIWYAGFETDSIDFGDGTVVANTSGLHLQHTYAANGIYTICRYISSPTLGCTDTFCQQIIISGVNQGCVVSVHPNYPGTNPLEVVLYGSHYSLTAGYQTAPTWIWDFGDGTIDSTSGNAPVHTFPAPGIYNVCVTAIDSAGCTAVSCTQVSTAGYIPPPLYCDASYFAYEAGLGYVNFYANTSGHSSETWDFGDGTVLTTKDVYPLHGYAANGTYYVCRTVSDSTLGCTDVYCDSVVVTSVGQSNGLCQTYFYGAPNPVYSQQLNFYGAHYSWLGTTGVQSWTWDFGDGQTLTTASAEVTHLYTQPGQYTVCITATDSFGCTSSYCQDILVEPAQVALGAVSGTITGGGISLDSGKVLLITIDPGTQVLSVLDSAVLDVTDNGEYTFANLIPGFYTVRAEPAAGSAFALDYVPTYKGNVVNWQAASFFLAGGSQPSVADVALVSTLLPTVNGTGVITGTIQAGANKTGSGTLAGVHLMLMNAAKVVVGQTHSDANGMFSFSGLPEGTYMVYVDMMNREMALKPMTLSAGNMAVNQLTVTVHETEITVDVVTSTAPALLPAATVSLYPNPVQADATLRIGLPAAASVDISVITSLGQEVLRQTQPLSAGAHTLSLEVTNLPAGVYTVQVRPAGLQPAAIRMVKE